MCSRMCETRGATTGTPSPSTKCARSTRRSPANSPAMHALLLLLLSLAARAVETSTPQAPMAAVPAGLYRPLFRPGKEKQDIPVDAFQLHTRPVTNGEFLAFVRAHPNWQRSKVKRL